MKSKRLSALLGCILTLAALAGLVVPIAGRAADYELTVLNPKAVFEPINNMPLADREPLRNKLVNKQPVRILSLHYNKLGDDNVGECMGIAIVLKDYWAQYYNYTNKDDISITAVWNTAAGTGAQAGLNSGRDWKAMGLPPPLGTPWGTKSGKNYIDGMPMKEEPFERYRAWSEYDAVIIGVAD
ncbi:MAG: hypothetical protein LBH28_01005 [Oscillospiraceae bacterium]|nr:hypothetical protein [Oscillospiraceae bacterium]